MNINFGPLLLDDEANAQLRPAFDPTLRRYTAELWTNGVLDAVHGHDDWFETADALTSTVDTFLRERGLRALSETERYSLYEGLLRTKGGTGYQVLTRQAARRT
ncbi:hypothetical protein [Streptomyces griseus]|uniref:hypothetical protein n=1 Tax=Streptomyces griseus TaxID=1911 RepID=UPI0033A3E062